MVEILLHAVMTKRSRGQSKFGRMNFKKRLFILTSESVKYNSGKDLDNTGTVKGEIKLSKIQIVEDVSGGSLSGQNGFPFQIVYNDTNNPANAVRLYVIAGLKKDKEEWVSKLRILIAQNMAIEASYHPGIFEKAGSFLKWSCCGALAVESKGCKNTYFHKDEVDRRKALIPKPSSFTVVAVWDLTAQQASTDLNLTRGEKLEVLDSVTDQHWWRARNAHGQVGMIPESYVRKDGVEVREWFHNIESRPQVEDLLKEHGKDCAFLVRPSARGKVKYSISIYYMGQVKHYHIQQADGYYWVNEKNKFRSVDELLDYHSMNCAGMVCRPRHPVLKDSKPAPILGNQFGNWLIDPKEVNFGNEIGNGQFGVVFKGKWRNYDVAIKTMKEGCMNEDDFYDEAKIMMRFNHPNLLRFHGIINHKGQVAILTEFMSFGDLFKYLQKHPALPGQTAIVIDMCRQIASAMKYLEDSRFIHRDLAARNCLVGHQRVIKVSDFGLSRFVSDDEYTASEGAKFPIKWSSPEVIDYGKYSSKSDVWSFGVTMWEILSGGQVPYRELNNQQVIVQIRRGGRLSPPHYATPKLIEIMERCWQHVPEDRITFEEIVDILTEVNFNS